ncbi:hypothetical protein Ciccas_007845, partial [Cichlidogyrus casuarinus]
MTDKSYILSMLNNSSNLMLQDESSARLFTFPISKQMLLTRAYYFKSSEFRCNSLPTNQNRMSAYMASAETSNRILICLLVNVDRLCSDTEPQVKNYDFSKFFNFLFEHYLQIMIQFEAASLTIIKHLLQTTAFKNLRVNFNENYLFNHSFAEPLDDASLDDTLNKTFVRLQRSFFELVQPRLTRPVWHSLNEASTFPLEDCYNESPSHWFENDLKNFSSSVLFSNYLNSDSSPSQCDALSYSFLKGCFGVLLTKAFLKDHAYFLSQLITGVLMNHNGWIESILSAQETPFLDSLRKMDLFACNSKPGSYLLARLKANPLLYQYLRQTGCSPTALSGVFYRLQSHHMLNSSTILCGSRNKEHTLALLYLVSYFIRFQHLTKARERLPDLNKSHLFSLEVQQRQTRTDSKARRKSGSAASGGSLFEQRIISTSAPQNGPDSGISSQEDLVNSVQGQSSSGSSPTHSHTHAVVPLVHQLTQSQCMLAQQMAVMTVSREKSRPSVSATLGQMSTPCYDALGSTANGASSFFNNVFGLIPGYGSSAGLPKMGASPMVACGTPPSGNLVTIDEGLVASRDRKPFTEIPLLLEKHFEEWDDVGCLCLGSSDLQSSSFTTSISPDAVSLAGTSPSSPTTSCSSGVQLPVGSPQSTCSIPYFSSPPRASNWEEVAHLQSPGGAPPPRSGMQYNHVRIGATLQEHYTNGFVLQATMDSFDSFKAPLIRNMTDYLRHAPSILWASLAHPHFDLREQRVTTKNNVYATIPRANRNNTISPCVTPRTRNANSVSMAHFSDNSPLVESFAPGGGLANNLWNCRTLIVDTDSRQVK